MNIFHRYVVKEHIAPFVFAFSVILFILILKLMLQLMDMLITKGVSVIIMFKLLVYNLAWMIALVVPMSVLVATLMAFGRMGASGEITAMKAAGISMYRIISPIILLSILFTIVMVWFNNNVLPVANHRASSLRYAIAMKKPMLTLKNREEQFISDLPEITIRVDTINYQTGEMGGVTLFKKEKNEYLTTIVAEKGWFETYSTEDRLALRLENGEIHRTNREQGRYIRSTFDEFRQLVRIDFRLDTSHQGQKSDRTMNSDEMREEIRYSMRVIEQFKQKKDSIPENLVGRESEIKRYDELIKDEEKTINKYFVEIHKKNSIPVAAIVFVLIGSSLGILVKRSGASIGIGISIGFFTLYNLFLIGDEALGDRMFINPWLAMWLPNLVFGAIGIVLIRYANRR